MEPRATHPPCPKPFNMAQYVLKAGQETPDKVALQLLGGQSLTYAELFDCTVRLAGGLSSIGLKSNAKIMFRLGNRVEFPIAYLACIWAGFVPVPTSAQLGRAEITAIADQLLPDLILCEDGITLPEGNASLLDLEALQGLMCAEPCAPILGDPERLAYIIFTSGTSGKPRGVRHAHRAIWARRMMFDGWYGLRSTDRMLHAGAFNWSYTMGTGLMDPWTMGATALIPAADMTTDELAKALRTASPTIFAAAPGIYRKLMKTDALLPAPILRHGLSAGEALPAGLRARWHTRMGCDIHEALGMSECSTFISGNPKRPAPEGTSGRAQLGRHIDIAPDGQLRISRDDPGMMLGYLNEGPVPQEWFETGDTVDCSPEGWITYRGRNDDIITAGGYRISPIEVEDAFANVPAVEECAAIEFRKDADTTLVALCYRSSVPLSDSALRAHAHKMLAGYKQPRLYFHVPSLPKGANGKLNRSALRRAHEAHTHGKA